tara:strand:- start:372 stop:494 length:123 start_codon:yes stop_codon:yes gene_type:complete
MTKLKDLICSDPKLKDLIWQQQQQLWKEVEFWDRPKLKHK